MQEPGAVIPLAGIMQKLPGGFGSPTATTADHSKLTTTPTSPNGFTVPFLPLFRLFRQADQCCKARLML